MIPELRVLTVDGLPEVEPGDDLVELVGLAARTVPLEDGDVVVVTSKVVSKAEGLLVTGTREDLIVDETDRIVASRGATLIVRTRHGLVLAGAGLDASNTAPGTVLPLPRDPDRTARDLRVGLLERTGRNLGVVVSDTAGRAWRTGQTDLAIGVAGVQPLDDYAGRVDAHGNRLSVTAPAIADEIAGAADLVTGKLFGRPVAIVRGLSAHVLPPGKHGPGAAALVRAEAEDLFGFGAREAVLRALAGSPDDLRGFGAPLSPSEAIEVVGRFGDAAYDGTGVVTQTDDPVLLARFTVACYACGWLPDAMPGRFVPAGS